MSEPDPTTTPPPAADPPKADPPANTVPYERFTEVNEKSKTLARENEELRQWKEEQETKSLSELERERKRAEDAEKRADEAANRVTSLERGGWVRAAAMDAKFLDPSDAVQFLDLAEVETETQAKNAVKRLAESKPHLLRSTEEKPGLSRVLQPENGKTKTAEGDDDDPKAALGEGLLNFLTARGQ